MTHSTTAHAQRLKQKDFAQELPKMDFQDQFVSIAVSNRKFKQLATATRASESSMI